MKLLEFHLRNFRGIESLDLDFRDEWGLPRRIAPIVGPNASGKTSILDAINLVLGPITESDYLRPGLTLHPSTLVRHGAAQAKADCVVEFSEQEVEEAQRLFAIVEPDASSKIPPVTEVKVHWEFPDLHGRRRTGWYRCEPHGSWRLFKTRKWIARTLHVPSVSPRDFVKAGGVFVFDQQRTGLVQRVSSLSRAVLTSGRDPDEPASRWEERADECFPSESLEDWYEDDRPKSVITRDPRVILLNLATRAQAAQDPAATEQTDYQRLCDLFATVCRPHRIKGLFNTESGLDVEFEGPTGVYLYDGLSSGEQMILQMLLHFATRRIHRSIVLIDELELHLHPLWQDGLYNALPSLGTDNQIIFTTHSTHLRNAIRSDLLLNTGRLEPVDQSTVTVGA